VIAAIPAIVAKHSNVGPSADPSVWGMKWSATQTPSQPVSSAWVTVSAVSDQGRARSGHRANRMPWHVRADASWS
jgi:hypothetical protein